ncbi:hypothetical protein [Vibrio hepatarius]|uniref:hypothetical protein n=1 Tax=Vibrio hepatarius TaxID=171383 RepID=UPI001C0A5F02|nr:hypothetical protein [Vibrio hepatarius]MBU2898324.1 hypothetical protein [Vibrio hepatarius]
MAIKILLTWRTVKMHDLDGKIYKVGSVLNLMYGEGKEYTVERSLVLLKTIILVDVYSEWMKEALPDNKPEKTSFNSDATIQFPEWLIQNEYYTEVCTHQIVYSCDHGVAHLAELID